MDRLIQNTLIDLFPEHGVELEPDEDWLRKALAALVAHVKAAGLKRLAVERFDGEPVSESEIMPLLVEAGFLPGPRRAVLRG